MSWETWAESWHVGFHPRDVQCSAEECWVRWRGLVGGWVSVGGRVAAGEPAVLSGEPITDTDTAMMLEGAGAFEQWSDLHRARGDPHP